jgi:hypothetical protein
MNFAFQVWVGVYPRRFGPASESGIKPDPHSEIGVYSLVNFRLG